MVTVTAMFTTTVLESNSEGVSATCPSNKSPTTASSNYYGVHYSPHRPALSSAINGTNQRVGDTRPSCILRGTEIYACSQVLRGGTLVILSIPGTVGTGSMIIHRGPCVPGPCIGTLWPRIPEHEWTVLEMGRSDFPG